MSNTGAPPVIPDEFKQYNSYVTDPLWQRKFSTIWPSVLAFFILISIPHVVRSFRNGRAYAGWLGIIEDLSESGYEILRIPNDKKSASIRGRRGAVKKMENAFERIGAVFYWTLPGIGLNAGQIIIIAAYIATVVACIVVDAPLINNSNRAGFIAIAQFPIIFLFATKNSIVSLLLGPGKGYEKLNFIHRWSGRVMFLGAVLHGALWIRNHLEYGIEIIGSQKETSGIAALGLLGVIVLSSLKPMRKLWYEVFFAIHMVAFIAFFVTICYHTLYAAPWIFPPLAFYGLDILLRMFRHRIKDALLVPVGNQMTLIHVPYATSGWLGGQHVRLRVFFSGRVFESHPLTIFSAPPELSCITSMPPGISFGARAVGDWTRALNSYANEVAIEVREAEKRKFLGGKNVVEHHKDKDTDEERRVEVPIQVMIDGPYGGCSVDLGEYETALLFAGGSGITFTLGVLDDIVGRCVRKGRKNGEKTRRIEFAWCVKSFGSIDWFAPALMDIASVAASSAKSGIHLDLHISIYVTCLCNPEAVPPIPNCDVTIVRPSVYRVLQDVTTPPKSTSSAAPDRPSNELDVSREKMSSPDIELDTDILDDSESNAVPSISSKLPWIEEGGGVAVCASGPESLTREASNAVARIQMSGKGRRLGGIGLHTEIFSL